MSKQIKTDVEINYKKRNQATVFWRGILVFPVLIFICSFAVQSNAGFAAGFIIVPALLALVFREVYPSYLLTFNHAFLELQTRVVAYVLLLTDDYPSIERNKNIEATFLISMAAKLSIAGFPWSNGSWQSRSLLLELSMQSSPLA